MNENVQIVLFKVKMSQFTRFLGVNFKKIKNVPVKKNWQVSCLIWPHKHKHPELHTSECTIVLRTVIFRIGNGIFVPNYICPKLLIKMCNYLLVSYVRNKYPEIYLSICSKKQIWTIHYYFLVRLNYKLQIMVCHYFLGGYCRYFKHK